MYGSNLLYDFLFLFLFGKFFMDIFIYCYESK
jgi:hypothetical protein